MARRGMTGQLNMFDFFRQLETNIPQDGELEMVSLMPSFEEDEIPVSSVEVEPVTAAKPVTEGVKAAEEKKTEVSKTQNKTQDKTQNKIQNRTKHKSIENKQEEVRTSKISEIVETKKEPKILEEPEIIQEHEQRPVSSVNIDKSNDRPVMQRTYTTKQGTVEIAYMNYSKVRVSRSGEESQIMEFASSKEAVDYYVEQMQKLEELYATDN